MVLLMNRSVDQKAKSWCYFLLLWNAACNEDYILLQFHHTTGSSLISSRNMNQRQHASLLYSMHEFQFLFQFWLGRWTVGQKGKPESWCCLLLYICSDIPVLVVTVNTESWCYLLLLWELGEMDLATRISLITPRSFDPTKPRELQVKLGKRWEVIGQDFAIEKVNNQTPPASAPASTPPPTPPPAPPASESEEFGTNSGSRQIVKIVCMSDTHSTQGEFG